MTNTHISSQWLQTLSPEQRVVVRRALKAHGASHNRALTGWSVLLQPSTRIPHSVTLLYRDGPERKIVQVIPIWKNGEQVYGR